MVQGCLVLNRVEDGSKFDGAACLGVESSGFGVDDEQVHDSDWS